MSEYIIQCKSIGKSYAENNLSANIFEDINVGVKSGEQIAILGSSGSGKTTLLHIMGGLITPSHGEVYIHGECINKISPTALGNLRNQHLGFIYQFHHLLPDFSALENVAMPLLIRNNDYETAYRESKKLLSFVGLEHRINHRPSEMSGGERQRTAVARAMVAKPKCVLADEPTGNLDHKIAHSVFQLLLDLNAEFQTSLVIVTHDLSLAKRMDRRLTLEHGSLRE